MAKKKENYSIKKAYYESFLFIKDSKNFIYSTILLFFIFFAIGFFFEDLVVSLFKNLFNVDIRLLITNMLQQLIEQTRGLSYFGLMKFIFFNNVLSSFYGVIFGIFFGVFPIIGAIFNGYVLGFVGLMSVKAEGLLILWKIFPHGIFELPAIFISLGLGIRLGMHIFIKEKVSFKALLINSIKVFLTIVVPLLVIAAFIEASLIFLGS